MPFEDKSISSRLDRIIKILEEDFRLRRRTLTGRQQPGFPAGVGGAFGGFLGASLGAGGGAGDLDFTNLEAAINQLNANITNLTNTLAAQRPQPTPQPIQPASGAGVNQALGMPLGQPPQPSVGPSAPQPGPSAPSPQPPTGTPPGQPPQPPIGLQLPEETPGYRQNIIRETLAELAKLGVSSAHIGVITPILSDPKRSLESIEEIFDAIDAAYQRIETPN